MEKVIKLKVVDVIKETGDAISIHFKQPFLKKIKYKSGQFLTLLVPIEGKVERRCYSLNSAPKVDKTISVTIKRVKDGKVSNHLFEHIRPGDTIKALSPMGSFVIDPDLKAQRHIVLFGAGSGITPLMSILKTILQVESKSIVSLFYGNRDEESIIFDATLKKFKEKFPQRLQLIHILSDPNAPDSRYKGRVERAQVPELLSSVPKYAPEKTLYFICGPSGMMIEAEEGLKAYGVAPKYIRIERFSAPPASAQEVKAEGALLENREVKIVNKGKEHLVPVKANLFILDAALDHKLDLPYVCLDGICGSCRATCSSGEVFMRKGNILSEKEIEEGQVLPCICKPLTNNVVIEYK